jgi:hypothetical protein
MKFSEFPKLADRNARTLMLAELESPLLSCMSEDEMAAMRNYTQIATTSLWVTNGDVLSGREPEKTLVFGIAKSIMTEQPSFHLASIDIDPDMTEEKHLSYAQLIVDMEVKFHQNPSSDMDTELVVKDEIVYTSRYVGDDEGNSTFAQIWAPKSRKFPLRSNLSMAFEKVGRLDSLYFQEAATPVNVNEPGESEILLEARAFGFDEAVRILAHHSYS